MRTQADKAERIAVRLPNWVGDIVLATPFYRALRAAYPAARITAVGLGATLGIVADSPWFDAFLPLPPRRAQRRPASFWRAAMALRQARFDTGYLLTNSLSSAALFWLGRVGRRIGYARDGRRLLLTDPLPVPRPATPGGVVGIKEYYLNLARGVGLTVTETRVELFLGNDDRAFAARFYAERGVGDGDFVVGMNPGAAYGAAKCWRADYYAATADTLVREQGARVVLFSGPGEERIVEEITRLMHSTPLTVIGAGVTLQNLKGLIARCDLFVGNDSGPIQYAIAFDLPVVTIFGSTPVEYAATDYPRVRQLCAHVACAPCNHRTCPIDHRCMSAVTPEWVIREAEALLGGESERSPNGRGARRQRPSLRP
ncbi:MAG: lipopolysaccharide heptosyltransferase II [Nitrospirae bacterium CG18_big_fil_WC_8_21_14_2_50_70_55]|nr:lipopolysaccharide heptosyltransferase II [Deltaproteobacteria bacterium]OIP62800.1 MAG: lipopolysaccharide heptosyltransferase II [Nitrospirae bacterium CG2_30_70_394]PIQ03465.1 MAG: lipopolysaccharide heptosyltransferase II [Nitrospirae bacterium CG18_big_fil_WC_8_21_14_2_50_70_55]PIU79948.1 MAG: lipopolysaccharide heptosyltransferase II [Nitrospirae bacterium CG06_land_8_20_14_3_00_70_43]PIW82286.1 MAG: lipopolysaccharide heptosyltransferase II [Nitrospirae bacterium CG_4_8_14_3_um_filter